MKREFIRSVQMLDAMSRARIGSYMVLFLAVISALGFLCISQNFYSIGFPLDDAWIHQTYARNLARTGTWFYVVGEPSAGSTAPLWSAMLAIGYQLNIHPYFWTFTLGVAALVSMVWVTMKRLEKMGVKKRYSILGGVFIGLNWHLTWASVSGMETLAFALVILLVIDVVHGMPIRWWMVGVLIGMSIWLRPDGITLLGPVILLWAFEKQSWHKKFTDLFVMMSILGVFLLAYMGFNEFLSGNPLPNTFYAKQKEYASLHAIPLTLRLWRQWLPVITGAGVLLIPGFLGQVFLGIRNRHWNTIAWVLWMFGYLGIYALMLPVAYQHGRYIMPVMAIYCVLAFQGISELVQRIKQRTYLHLLERAWGLALLAVLVVFWVLGARAYALDVAIIETEMVKTARWVEENTPSQAKIAAHDIGALGYFTKRRFVDLAGLVSPQVIPFLRDEGALARYLDEQCVDYLVAFPGWYPELVNRGQEVYRTNSPFSKLQGGENMAVYLWNKTCEGEFR